MKSIPCETWDLKFRYMNSPNLPGFLKRIKKENCLVDYDDIHTIIKPYHIIQTVANNRCTYGGLLAPFSWRVNIKNYMSIYETILLIIKSYVEIWSHIAQHQHISTHWRILRILKSCIGIWNKLPISKWCVNL